MYVYLRTYVPAVSRIVVVIRNSPIAKVSYAHTYMYVRTYVRTYMYVYIHTYMYVHTYILTYIRK